MPQGGTLGELSAEDSALPCSDRLDERDIVAFDRDGYLIKRGLFTADEVKLCNRVIATDPAIQGSRLKLADAAGGSTELALWNHPGEDVFAVENAVNDLPSSCRRCAEVQQARRSLER